MLILPDTGPRNGNVADVHRHPDCDHSAQHGT
jgi:hypothetical protein